MKNTIILDIYAGIGNRFQGLSALSRVYKDLNCKCVIFWRIENSCNIRYEDLLKKEKNISVINLYDTGLRKNPFRTVIGRMIVCLCRAMAGRRYTLDEMHAMIRNIGYTGVLEILKTNRMNYIYSRSSFVPFSHDDLELIECSDEVRNRGAALWESLENSGGVIGIHIRRTDNRVSIENSPVELFMDAMDREMDKDENVRFYLCTDDEAVQNDLIEKYGKERFIIYQKINNRTSKAGLQDALVEMMALSKCDKIIGSYGSTFSYFASVLGQKEYVVVQKGGDT